MDTFLTVLKIGGAYRAGHVSRLQAQIDAHYSGARHICLTDDAEVTGDVIALTMAWPGWWSKLELFRHDLGRCCYFDLDVTVNRSLAWVDQLPPAELWAMQDAFLPGMNSSVMIWEGAKPQVFEGFDPTLPEPRLRGGDQKWIGGALGSSVCFLHPPQVSSFKKHGAGSASVVVYHGHPKPWDTEGLARWNSRTAVKKLA